MYRLHERCKPFVFDYGRRRGLQRGRNFATLPHIMGAVQHELFPFETGVSRDLLAEMLNDGAPRPVKLTVTRNRVSMASVDFSSPRFIKVRLHERFLTAPREVIQSLRQYLGTHRRSDWKPVAEFARSIVGGRPRPARRTRPKTSGEVYDLREIKDEVNRRFFNRRVSCRIEWGRASNHRRGRRKTKSIRYGSYDAEDGVVRINPILDDRRVPYDFVRYIVFHEMLHVLVPTVCKNGKRYYHPPTFQCLERSFPDLTDMKSMARDLVEVLA